jgi:sortase (surface protein transpeptidase)
VEGTGRWSTYGPGTREDTDNVEVMEPEAGKSLVSLQTCTLPDYSQRLIVQGELVEKSA